MALILISMPIERCFNPYPNLPLKRGEEHKKRWVFLPARGEKVWGERGGVSHVGGKKGVFASFSWADKRIKRIRGLKRLFISFSWRKEV
jgi:hypothetical protein